MRSTILLLIPGLLLVQSSNGQDLAGHFKFSVNKYDGHRYVTFEPDSAQEDPAIRSRCAALWNYRDYLYQNYANASMKGKVMGELYPDTAAIWSRFKAYMAEDTAFTRMYLRAFASERVAPLHIDSALRIASHFYYVHRDNGKPTVHICIGINKVKELGRSEAHPQYAAFCYMTIWEMEDNVVLYQKVRGPFADEVKKGVSDERLSEIEQEVYARIAALPELRQALIDTYARKAKYMPFELIR